MRTLLLTGPGGAGTSTLAAAAAVRSARAGQRTVLLSRQAAPVPGLDGRRRSGRRPRRPPGDRRAAVGRRGRCRGRPRPAADPAAGQLGGADPGHRRARAVRRARPGRGRPRRPGRRPAGGDGRARGPAGGAALVARPAHAAGHAGPRRRPHGRRRAGAAKRGPVDAALAAVPVVEQLLARNRLADPTTVCLVAEPRRTTVPAAARGGHDAGPARPAHRRRCSPGCCRRTARGSGRPGGPPSRTPSSPGSPRWRRCTACPSTPSRRRTSTSWPACSTASTCPRPPRPGRPRPSGTTEPGS